MSDVSVRKVSSPSWKALPSSRKSSDDLSGLPASPESWSPECCKHLIDAITAYSVPVALQVITAQAALRAEN